VRSVLTNSRTEFSVRSALRLYSATLVIFREFAKSVPSSEVPDEDGESVSSRQGEVIAAEARELKLGVQKNTRG
jgi:hypothetical protein